MMDEPRDEGAPSGNTQVDAKSDGRELSALETTVRRLVEELYPVLEELPDDRTS